MFADDNTVKPHEIGDFERQLEFLYARREAIDALIASLEEYDRYRCVPDPPQQRKLA
ncbi:MAG TPA: hypothetical protein VMA31_04355 [Bryobacteraceae bacterium]|nr:hypothetical protein [Bryobacteraceae bacterium]